MARLRRQDPRSDEALVAACNSGDAAEAADAFEALYRRHRDYVLRVALRFVPDTDTALDVLQETFAYLLRRFPPTGEGVELTAKLTTFLYPVAKNNAITALRKSGRFPTAEDVGPDDLPGPDLVDSRDIRRVLAVLPTGQREVLELRFVDDLSLQEIAAVLDIALGTVKSRLHLGIARLKASEFAKNFNDD
ncbi:MAG: sigma-70 family RNA polymerase sigma factor [Gammaproteobacteria bacterium]|nr:sigma-70 family RNA polymerase sigma factor [Gammaproteobacteria bacterium]